MRITIRGKKTDELPLDQRAALASIVTMYYTSYTKQKQIARHLGIIRDQFPQVFDKAMAERGVRFEFDKSTIQTRALTDAQWLATTFFPDLDVEIDLDASSPGEPVDID